MEDSREDWNSDKHSDWQREMEEQSTEQTEGHDCGQFVRVEVAVTRVRADFSHSQAEPM